MSRKGVVFLGVFLLGALMAFPVFGASFSAGDEYTLPIDELFDDDLYVASGGIIISGTIQEDLVAAGGNILINGSIAEDVLSAAGTFNLLGPVGGDVRVAGGQIVIGDTVTGDLVMMGGNASLLEGGKIIGDLVATAGQVSLEGDVGGNVNASGGKVYINGEVAGTVTIGVADRIIIGPDAVIGGDVVYASRREAEIDSAAQIAGSITYEEKGEVPYNDPGPALVGLFGTLVLFKFLGLLIAAVLAAALFKNFSVDMVGRTLDHFWKDLLRGFVVLIVGPALVVVLFMTVVGIYIGLLVSVLYAALLFVSSVFGAVLFGGFLAHLAHRKEIVDWKWAALGVIILAILQLIPVIGWLVNLVFFLAALGFVYWAVHQRIWAKR